MAAIMENVALILCVLVQSSTGFEWASSGNFPDGYSVTGCPGQDLTLPWTYRTTGAEHVTNVEWHYTPWGGSNETVLAVETEGSYVYRADATQHVQFIPNAGLALTKASAGDSGLYAVQVTVELHGSISKYSQSVRVQVRDLPVTDDGQLHARMTSEAVYVRSTGLYHVQLSCGSFLPYWGSNGVTVSWKTPNNETLPSTSYNNGHSYLTLSNPPLNGDYTCVIEDTSVAFLCVGNASPLRNGATVHVDSTQAQFAIMQTQIKQLQTQEQQLQSKMSAMEQLHQQEKASLQQQLQNIQAENTVLTDMLNGKIQSATQSVSFHAWRNHWDRTLESGDVVAFGQVISNQGNAYDSQTGKFTVPVNGTYAFFVTIVTDETSPTLENTDAGLYADNDLLASTYSSYDHGHHESGSCQAIVFLRAGQTVLVRNLNSAARYYPSYSTFSGVLLHAA